MYEGSVGSISTPSLARQKLVLWLALGIILSVSLLAFVSIERLIAANERVQDRLTLIVEVDRYLSNLKDVETGGRGYALSGDIRHLQRENAGIAAVEATEARLQALSHEPELQRQLDRLLPLTEERIAASRQLVAERKNLEATRRNLLTGMQLMDRIRDEVAAILSTQQREYRDERQVLERQAWITSIALAAGIILCLIVIAWLFSLRGREVERRRQLEEELRALNLDLEDHVQERTAQLRHSEERASQIIDAALDAVITIDASGSITGWNPQTEKIFGWTREEALGRPIDETIMPQRFRQAHKAGLARYLATGEAHVLNKRIELTALRKSGEEFPIELAITPVLGDDGTAFSAFIRDTTDTKAREAEVKQARDLLNAVVENLPDMILLKEPADGGFRYVLVNAAGERLMGRGRDDMLGCTERDVFPPDEALKIVEASRAVAASGLPRIFTGVTLTTAMGVRTMEIRMVPVPNGASGPVMILTMVRDVTDELARDEQVRQLQRMDAVGQLTGGVAHDFNNLLAIIHGNSELLRERLDDGSDAATMTDDVIGAAARGAELVRRLLAYARMQHLEPESIDLNARLQNVLGLLQRAIGENVALRVKTAKKLWPATVDPTQVDDALVNLAINARDAMHEGGTLSIETQNVTLDDDYAATHLEVVPGDYVMLAVSDTGCGMTPDVIARAFEPFFTTKVEGQGTGLGLSQVFGWVKQSRGHIKIYSEVGHGTTVKLYLPRAAKQSVGKEAEAETVTPKGDEMILVVEDNPNVRKTVVRQLHDLGYKTVEAESGAQAMQKVKGGLAFDLLLTDVVMPGGITGYQLADQLRIDRPDLKVLFSSGYTELAAAGGDLARKGPLLSKPYRKQDLGRTIRAILDEPATSNAA